MNPADPTSGAAYAADCSSLVHEILSFLRPARPSARVTSSLLSSYSLWSLDGPSCRDNRVAGAYAQVEPTSWLVNHGLVTDQLRTKSLHPHPRNLSPGTTPSTHPRTHARRQAWAHPTHPHIGTSVHEHTDACMRTSYAHTRAQTLAQTGWYMSPPHKRTHSHRRILS